MNENKVLKRVEVSLQQGNYYEAQQQIMTLYSRLCQKDKRDEAIKMTCDGARIMFEHAQFASGLDLCKKLMELGRPEDRDVDGVFYKDRMVELCELIPPGDISKSTLLKQAIKWTSPSGRGHKGYSKLHWHYARELWVTASSKDDMSRPKAKYQFALAMPEATFDAIEHIMKKVKEEEGDGSVDALEIMLCILKEKELGFAKFFLDQFLKIYESHHGNTCVVERLVFPIELVVYTSSALNTAQLLLVSIQRDAHVAFKKISEFMMHQIRESSLLSPLLTQIETVWFPKFVQPAHGFPSMFSNLLKNVLGMESPTNTITTSTGSMDTLIKDVNDLD